MSTFFSSGESSLSSSADFNVELHVNQHTLFVPSLKYITHSPLRCANQNPQVLSDLLASAETPETGRDSEAPQLSDTQCSVNVILFSKKQYQIDFLHPIKGCVKLSCQLVFFGWVISVHYIFFFFLQWFSNEENSQPFLKVYMALFHGSFENICITGKEELTYDASIS